MAERKLSIPKDSTLVSNFEWISRLLSRPRFHSGGFEKAFYETYNYLNGLKGSSDLKKLRMAANCFGYGRSLCGSLKRKGSWERSKAERLLEEMEEIEQRIMEIESKQKKGKLEKEARKKEKEELNVAKQQEKEIKKNTKLVSKRIKQKMKKGTKSKSFNTTRLITELEQFISEYIQIRYVGRPLASKRNLELFIKIVLASLVPRNTLELDQLASALFQSAGKACPVGYPTMDKKYPKAQLEDPERNKYIVVDEGYYPSTSLTFDKVKGILTNLNIIHYHCKQQPPQKGIDLINEWREYSYAPSAIINILEIVATELTNRPESFNQPKKPALGPAEFSFSQGNWASTFAGKGKVVYFSNFQEFQNEVKDANTQVDPFIILLNFRPTVSILAQLKDSNWIIISNSGSTTSEEMNFASSYQMRYINGVHSDPDWNNIQKYKGTMVTIHR